MNSILTPICRYADAMAITLAPFYHNTSIIFHAMLRLSIINIVNLKLILKKKKMKKMETETWPFEIETTSRGQDRDAIYIDYRNYRTITRPGRFILGPFLFSRLYFYFFLPFSIDDCLVLFRSRGLDRVASCKTETFESRDRDETENFEILDRDETETPKIRCRYRPRDLHYLLDGV